MHKTLKISIVSLFVAVGVLILKFLASKMMNSLALYSDALESLVNVASALAAMAALHVSAKPADHRHPYGHHKAEYFSAVLGGVLIVLSAITIFREIYFRFHTPQSFEFSWPALGFNGLACVINAGWAWILNREGRRSRSPALLADAKHLWSDVISSVGVFGGVLIVYLGGWPFFDLALAGAVALNILWSGWVLVCESIGGLMDVSAPPGELENIRKIISEHSEGAMEAHDLRTRHAGKITFVEFHLVVPGESTVLEAHRICDRIEIALKEILNDPIITIHVEPETQAKHKGIVVL